MADAVNTQGTATPVAVPTDNQAAVTALHRYRLAYEQTLPITTGLDPKELLPINIDVPSAVARTAGKLAGIMALRESAKALGNFDVTVFDQLETYALALAQAHTKYMGASAAPEGILELNERGMKLRNVLYADALALATRNLISGDRIGELKANIGYQNLAFDLMALAGILRDNWDKISSKTAITTDDLDQAELIGDQLIDAVGTREDSPANVAEITLQRQRNFTLFVNAYDEVRRAVSFLRWKEDDLERVAPSLYAGRGNSNIRKKSDDTAQPAPGAAADAPTSHTPVAATPVINTPVAAGLPGSSPFSVS